MMKELDLALFLRENDIEMRWDDDMLSTWIPVYYLDEFIQLVSSALHDGGVEARLLHGGDVWLDLTNVCDYHGIDPERIFPRSVDSPSNTPML